MSNRFKLEAEKSRIETHRDALKDGQAEQSRQLKEIVSERDRLREKVDDLETETGRLQRQLAAANSRQDDLGEIVEYVEEEKSLTERREDRQQSPIWRRAWWWITGPTRGR